MVALATGEEGAPIGARLDYSYDQFQGKRILGKETPDAVMHIVTANIVATLPAEYAKPYLLAGLGWYPYRNPIDAKRDNSVGVNIGVGLTFPFIVGAGFVEGRFHHVVGRTTAQEFLPVTVGVVF